MSDQTEYTIEQMRESNMGVDTWEHIATVHSPGEVKAQMTTLLAANPNTGFRVIGPDMSWSIFDTIDLADAMREIEPPPRRPEIDTVAHRQLWNEAESRYRRRMYVLSDRNKNDWNAGLELAMEVWEEMQERIYVLGSEAQASTASVSVASDYQAVVQSGDEGSAGHQ